jgi:hypothetical protein
MKSLSKLFFVFILILWGSNATRAQGSIKADKADKAIEVKHLVNSGRYTFEATKVILPKGSLKPINSWRDLDIAKDTVIAYLPDLGTAHTATSGARAAGITCTRFSYNRAQGKNGHWEVTILPKEKPGDMKDVKKIKLDISSLGYTTLTVVNTKGSSVSYYGYIKEHSAEFPRVSAQR